MDNAQRTTQSDDTEKTCRTCNTPFTANAARHIYCSDNCRVKAHHAKKRETKLAAERLRVHSKVWRTTVPVTAITPARSHPHQVLPSVSSTMPLPATSVRYDSLPLTPAQPRWEVRKLESDLAYLQEGYHWPQTCLWLGASTGLLVGLLTGKRQPMGGQTIVRLIVCAVLLGIVGWVAGYYIGRWTLSVDSYRQQQVQRIEQQIAQLAPLAV